MPHVILKAFFLKAHQLQIWSSRVFCGAPNLGKRSELLGLACLPARSNAVQICVPTSSRRQERAANFIGQDHRTMVTEPGPQITHKCVDAATCPPHQLMVLRPCPPQSHCSVCGRNLNMPVEAAAAMCKLLGDKYYSGSAADTLLAARSYAHPTKASQKLTSHLVHQTLS